ncbi:MAG: phosphoserine phosphatase RsbU/P, partial [Bryobacterales bacterium]|nr:phosphoserine phosphatase RsbU/P [Bryobacterales bacterium]
TWSCERPPEGGQNHRGRVSDPVTAALSGSQNKAPGSAGGYLLTHLSAIFRSLLSLDLPLTEVMSRANRLFCESTPATHYATLVAGRTSENGMDLCNAGHCRPLLLRDDGIERIDPTGLPLGLFATAGTRSGRSDSPPATALSCIRTALQRRKIRKAMSTRKNGSSVH